MFNSCYATDRHCRRVASLADRVAERLGVGPVLRRAIEDAAVDHQKFRLSALRRGSGPPGPAGRILQLFAGAGRESAGEAISVAADALAVCEAFDTSVEYGVYEGQLMVESFREFFDDAGFYPEPVVSALRDIVLTQPTASATDAIPVLPSAAAALLRMSPETASAAQLATLAERDPVLTARLLGLANSAGLGSRVEIRGVRDAVLRIGVPLAHKALMAATLGQLFASSRLQSIWKHSRDVAAIAHELAPLCGCDPHEAWLAGLLHDIGRILFETSSANDCAHKDAWVRAGFPLSYAETIVWGIDHANAGADLLERWNVPEELAGAIRLHASPERVHSALPALLYIADSVSAMPDDYEPPDLAFAFRKTAALAITGLQMPAVEALGRESDVFALAS